MTVVSPPVTATGRHRAGNAPVLLVLAAATLFGTVGTARALGPDVPGASIGALRLVIGAAGLVLLALALGHRIEELLRLARLGSVWWAAAAMAAFQVTFLEAVSSTGVAIGTLVAIGSAPVFTGLLTRLVTRTWVVATAVGVAGLALLVLGDGVDAVSPAGVLLALGAGLSYAVYMVATKAFVSGGADPVAGAATTFVLAALLLAPALVLADLSWAATTGGLATVVYLGVVPTTLAYALLGRGLRGLPARSVSTLGLAEPLVAAVLGVVVLDERLAPVAVLGALLVLAALLIVAHSGGGTSRRAGQSLA
jgi:DME family drug/metabolite transporter